ncbi:MAG TPA: LysR family transcriptional regulator [Kribbella sp.]|uniref:LysR family transcriptional regulator n=1 Tax=Kribbella sp. TaxID=1871183 RepID=UPI002D76B5F0|nr:LysR family transcriptional regulator [Kribbella sp.]HET6297310.1 LysR family transcriptional regulator [Kribbella sp.]
MADEFTGEQLSDALLRETASIQTAWLHSFLAVADQGGFAAATTALHLSQPRVSAHIASLEHVLGAKLFERRSRPTTLTPAGELFRPYAEAALRRLHQGVEVVRNTINLSVGKIAIGSYPSVSSSYLPSVLRVLTAEHPGITTALMEGTAASLETALLDGTVDVGFRPLLPPIREFQLSTRPIWREPVVAVLRADHPLAAQPAVSVEDLLANPLIGNPSGTEEEGGGFDLRRVLGAEVGRANIAYVTDQPATLAALVRSGFGIGVINTLAMTTTSADDLVSRPIESPTAHRDVALFWNPRRSRDQAVRAFLQAIDEADIPDGVVAWLP